MKEFLPYDSVRIDALKLAHKIYQQDKFVPDVIYTSLRGGAYMANVISEYYKVALKNHKPVLYAAVVARSYTDVSQHSAVRIDGWTYSPDYLRAGDKIMLVDDIFDSGRTLNYLVGILLERGVPRENIKIVVHDYKVYKWKEQLPIQPDYWCRKFEISNPEENNWINYNSHELVGLTHEELEENFYKPYPDLREVLEPIFKDE
ncbi:MULTISPECIES: phosphoribosyltransferase [Treponema]|uniref:Phosphoribosyl transferase domain protein n=1 Tax=Treponema succinifaciens (strain ATCC 33096 / DSM 2489 / 6091) TaxID=869209 RepID=F2NSI2_TRES6|nr:MULTISPECIES: phosphoribosyltransferase family protein [Treponema]AEB14756.1 phosphoribosyl transferase domain protein [Treponema succinifaciens DSM 2489]MCI6913155.1 phosphoribosyltransferase [Treponema succinifaciens]MDD6961666.1 phosphoribosyltransferase family protein [Treponema succinifaciens]MDY2616947.1 phosphoribosyltransferase family protein [Treponema succinifaciens]MDY5117337.1 phosphoribosyltransferase family protein [Treponema succinifaciens]